LLSYTSLQIQRPQRVVGPQKKAPLDGEEHHRHQESV